MSPLRAPPPTITSTPGVHPSLAALGLAGPSPLLVAGGIRPSAAGLILATPSPGPILLASGGLGVGGNHALRGVKPYTLLTPNATVASPYGVAQIHAARDAAGVNGVVRFPAGVTFAGGVTMSAAGQTWQGADGALPIINGGLTVTATGCTLEGFQVNNDIILPSSGNGHNFTMRNVKRQGGGGGFQNSGRSGMRVLNCEFYGTTNHFVGMVGNLRYSNTLGHIDGVLIENCIAIKTTGPSQSVISGIDHDTGSVENGTMKNFVVRNCYFDGGIYTADVKNSPSGGGWFGIEVWHNIPNAAGIGGIVEYCDLRGGNVLMSMVRSRNNWIHHNKLTLATGFAAYEAAGSAGNPARGDHFDLLFEFNDFFGRGTFCCEMITQNNGAKRSTIRQNRINDVLWIQDNILVNDGHVITDNCTSNVQNIPGPVAGNTIARNGPGEGPCD